jgi:hypothetical protein
MKTADKLALARRNLASWEKRNKKAFRVMVRSDQKIELLNRQIKRLEQKLVVDEAMAALEQSPPAVVAQVEAPTEVTELTPYFEEAIRQVDDGLEIPGFLKRAPGPRRMDRDAEQAAKIRAEVEARSRAKSIARIAKMKAKRSGETKKLPLTGRDALRAISESVI